MVTPATGWSARPTLLAAPSLATVGLVSELEQPANPPAATAAINAIEPSLKMNFMTILPEVHDPLTKRERRRSRGSTPFPAQLLSLSLSSGRRQPCSSTARNRREPSRCQQRTA